jgi:hypothetical protein
MSLTQHTDAHGNRLDLIRQIPQWSMTLKVTAKDGSIAEVELSGQALEQVAAALAEAAQSQQRLAKSTT